jgi:hypothetical protein
MALGEIEIRAELDRVLQSRALEGSETRRALLRYMAEKSLAGHGDQLKEYTIAVDALGKPTTYDPRHDSTVRIQVGRLRQKLVEYYANEGARDPVLIGLRKGSYRMDFQPASGGTVQVEGTVQVPEPSRWRTVALAAAVLALAALAWAVYATVALRRLRIETEPVREAWSPELGEIWGPIIDGQRPVVVCVGAPTFVNFSSHVFLRVSGANNWEDTVNSPKFEAVKRAFPDATTVPWHSFTGVGEANGAFLVGELLSSRKSKISFTRSDLLSFQEMSDSNVIFIGPPKFNAQLSAIPIKPAMVMERSGVRLLEPGRSEQAMYTDHFVPGADFDGESYALISRTPGLSGNGEVLLLGGNGTPDTLGAAQWVTQPNRARQLCSHLRLPSGQLPRYFQVMLKVRFKNGVPVDSSYVLHRALRLD